MGPDDIVTTIVTAGIVAILVIAVVAWRILEPGRIHRSRTARADMVEATKRHGPGATFTPWTNDPTGIGVITFERGSVQAYLEADGYRIEWFGRRRHPVPHDSAYGLTHAGFLAKLGEWTNRGHVHRRDPEAHAHGMLI